MPLPGFIKRPVVLLQFLIGVAGLIALFTLLGLTITHKETESIGLTLGVLALLSGVIGLGAAFRNRWKATGSNEDLVQGDLQLS
jgi:hypothetical protein